ncbi:MAG: hypothetical protein ACE5D6_05070 [Candidatus Zixiibacteriota bacterium]
MKKTIRKFKETVEIKSSIINRIRTFQYLPVLLLVSFFLIAACIHIWQRVKVIELVKDVARLKKENAGIMDDKKKLYSEIAALSMVSRIEKYAFDSLGLKPVSAKKLITLVRKQEKHNPPDELELMVNALKRMADYIPVIEGTRANAGGTDNLLLDSTISYLDNR